MPDSRFENFYYKLPAYLQNAIFSVHGWNSARKRYNKFFFEHLNRLKNMESWTLDRILDYQNKKIADIIRHAYKTVPFYRAWYDNLGISTDKIRSLEDLKRLPILTKKLLKNNNSSFISSSFKRKELIQELTSGSTGTPLLIYKSLEGLAFQWAIWWRHRFRYGINLKDRQLTFGGKVPISLNQNRPPYWRNDYYNNRIYLSMYHLSKSTLQNFVEYIDSANVTYFTGYTSAMYVLASLMCDKGIVLSNPPKYIFTSSDMLLPKYESAIAGAFNAPVTEHYGMVEFAGNMSKCIHGNLHVDFECCHIEALPSEGSDYYKLICTGWGNLAMPLIRYEVGDYGELGTQPCPCGLHSPYFTRIDGRLEDYILTPDGRRIYGMPLVVEYAENVREIQTRQISKDEIEFWIVPHEGFNENDKSALIREFKRRAGADMTIKFKLVEKLERSRAGKFKPVIREIDAS